MSASWLRRLRTLIRADAHGVLESLEERSLLLKQYVREAELELGRKQARMGALEDERKHLRVAEVRLAEEIESLDADVSLALREERDEVARFAIRRLLPRRQELSDLRQRLKQRDGEHELLAARLRAQQEQFEELKQRVAAELRRCATGATCAGSELAADVADEEIELELLRRRAQGGVA